VPIPNPALCPSPILCSISPSFWCFWDAM
jgi:hypothetical protein